MRDSPLTRSPGASVRRILLGVAWAAAVVAPLFLLLDPHAGFLQDWPLHGWIIDYYAEYFRQHGDVPTVINLVAAIGIAMPVYYGWLLYPGLGILSALVGSAVALRLALALMLVIQFVALLSAGRKIFQHRGLAFTVAASVIWATYSLTNLYNRGAIAEYFGTGFYMTALAWGSSAAVTPPGAARRFLAWLAGFFLLLAVGAHPPTALLAAGFLGWLGLTRAMNWRRGRWCPSAGDARLLVVALLLGALVLAPWVYANLGSSAGTGVTLVTDGFHFRPDHCDTFWGRFAPFPFDASSLEEGLNTQGAPYLEAQINVVLLGLLLWNLGLCWQCRRETAVDTVGIRPSSARGILGFSIAWFLFLATFSLSPWLADHFQFLAPYIQYVYRLVTHCNAALLVAVFASGVLVTRWNGYRRFQHATELVLAAGLSVAALGLMIKLQHGALAEGPDADHVISLTGGQTEIARAYEVPGLVRELSDEEVQTATNVYFPVGGAGRPFGEVGPLGLRLQRSGWVQTNALVHPWLKLEADGRVLDKSEVGQVGHLLAVHLAPGVHELRLIWEPDPVWRGMYRVSQSAFVLLIAITLVWSALRLRQLFTFENVRAVEPTP